MTPLSYTEHGAPQGAPQSAPQSTSQGAPLALLLHGAASHGGQWRALVEVLSAPPSAPPSALGGSLPWRVVTVDQYGYGASAPWAEERPMTLDDQVAPIARWLLAREGDEELHIIGHSHGATLAARLCARLSALGRPPRSLCLFEPNSFGLLTPARPEEARALAEARALFGALIARPLHEGGAALFAEGMLDFWLGAGAWGRLDERGRRQLERVMGPTLGEVRAVLDAPMDLAPLRALGGRVTLMCDPHTPPAALAVTRSYQRLLPEARVEELPGCGHLAPIHHADRVNALIEAHLSRAVAPRARAPLPSAPLLSLLLTLILTLTLTLRLASAHAEPAPPPAPKSPAAASRADPRCAPLTAALRAPSPERARAELRRLLSPREAPRWGYKRARRLLFERLAAAEGGAEGLYTGRAARGGRRGGGGMNCEHLWPRAWMSRHDREAFRQQEADLHNLFIADARVNARRGSLPFGEVEAPLYPDAAPSEVGRDAQGREVVEVRPARRGDAARALTYMAARWGLRFPTPHARLLLAWSAQDPPDERERRRNDEVERLQGNRNLLVDCPALLEGALRVVGD